MQADIHPKYDFVVFKDGLVGTMFLSKSTMTSKDKVKYTDGKEYPLVTVEISSASHPFFTGQQQLVDTAGRVERFRRKVANADAGKATAAAKASATKAAAAK